MNLDVNDGVVSAAILDHGSQIVESDNKISDIEFPANDIDEFMDIDDLTPTPQVPFQE